MLWSLMVWLPQIHSVCPFVWGPMMAFSSYSWPCLVDSVPGNDWGAWAMRMWGFTEPLIPPVSWLIHVIVTPRYFPNTLPQLPGTLNKSVCSWPPLPPKACTCCSSVRKIRVDSSAPRTKRLPLPQTFILLLQWDKMHVFKLERVKVLP